jgi:phosphopantetheinyl transferase (holo-ACP synthase)
MSITIDDPELVAFITKILGEEVVRRRTKQAELVERIPTYAETRQLSAARSTATRFAARTAESEAMNKKWRTMIAEPRPV